MSGWLQSAWGTVFGRRPPEPTDAEAVEASREAKRLIQTRRAVLAQRREALLLSTRDMTITEKCIVLRQVRDLDAEVEELAHKAAAIDAAASRVTTAALDREALACMSTVDRALRRGTSAAAAVRTTRRLDASLGEADAVSGAIAATAQRRKPRVSDSLAADTDAVDAMTADLMRLEIVSNLQQSRDSLRAAVRASDDEDHAAAAAAAELDTDLRALERELGAVPLTR